MSSSPDSSGNGMQEPHKIQRMFAEIATRYDLANHVLSMGLDHGWRKRTVRELAEHRPRSILDVATGSGDLALAIRSSLPDPFLVGADFCEPMLRQAQKKSLDNLVVADGMNLPFTDSSFDALTIAFGLRNMENIDRALTEFARVLNPDGRVYILDFSLPPNVILRELYRLYLHAILPFAAGILTGQKDAYQYLGASIEDFPSGQNMLDRMRSAGFTDTGHNPLSGGIVTLYQGKKSQ